MISSTLLQPRWTRAIRERLVQEVPAAKDFLVEGIHHDAHEWVVTLREAIGKLLPPDLGEQWLQLTNVGILQENRCLRPGCLHVSRMLDVRSCLSLAVVDSVTGDNLTTVEAAIANQLREEVTKLRCATCGMEGSRQSRSLSVLPKVKSLHPYQL